MAEIKWTPLALDDLQGIYDYIAKDSSAYAGRFVDKLIDKVGILELQPECGRVVPEFNKDYIRELIEGSYRIVYKVIANEVSIIRIHHSARLLKINTSNK